MTSPRATPLALLGALWGCPAEPPAQRTPPILEAPAPTTPKPKPAPARAPDDGAQALLQAHRAQRSGVWMEVEGEVERTLSDDDEGDRHQRFIIRVGELTVLVAHNIDLAERAPVKAGARVRVRGRYEYNDRGGVLHWTHRDPKGKQQGGFILVGDRKVR